MLSDGRAMQGMPWRKQHVSRDAAVQFSGKACYSRYARAVKSVLKDSDAGNACSKAVLNVAVFFPSSCLRNHETLVTRSTDYNNEQSFFGVIISRRNTMMVVIFMVMLKMVLADEDDGADGDGDDDDDDDGDGHGDAGHGDVVMVMLLLLIMMSMMNTKRR